MVLEPSKIENPSDQELPGPADLEVEALEWVSVK
jgi:hypothetical protein